MTFIEPIHSPIFTSHIPTLHDGMVLTDPIEYRSVFDDFQYLYLTRLDIAFLVNKLYQFMHHPTFTHWPTIKCLLHYLVGIPHHGPLLHKNSLLHFHVFSNANWIGNLDDRSLTRAHIVFVISNTISLSSKKQRSITRSSIEFKY